MLSNGNVHIAQLGFANSSVISLIETTAQNEAT